MIREIGRQNSIFNTFLAQMRDTQIQKDSMRFRRNVERLGEIFAYEVSKELTYEQVQVQTPLGVAEMSCLVDQVVLGAILRAGLPLHQGLLNYFDNAENAFISAYRKYGKDNKFSIQFGYLSSPSLEGKILILADPMLATGASVELAYRAMLERGTPKHTHIVLPLASKDGVEYIQKNLNMKKVTLWIGAIDEELTVKSYIVPGLGDAGDLAFGSKI